jgi:hypothetical protein
MLTVQGSSHHFNNVVATIKCGCFRVPATISTTLQPPSNADGSGLQPPFQQCCSHHQMLTVQGSSHHFNNVAATIKCRRFRAPATISTMLQPPSNADGSGFQPPFQQRCSHHQMLTFQGSSHHFNNVAATIKC